MSLNRKPIGNESWLFALDSVALGVPSRDLSIGSVLSVAELD